MIGEGGSDAGHNRVATVTRDSVSSILRFRRQVWKQIGTSQLLVHSGDGLPYVRCEKPGNASSPCVLVIPGGIGLENIVPHRAECSTPRPDERCEGVEARC